MVANSTEHWYTGDQARTPGMTGEDYVFGFKQRIAVSVVYCLIATMGITGMYFKSIDLVYQKTT